MRLSTPMLTHILFQGLCMITFNLSVLVLLCNLEALNKSRRVPIEHLDSKLEQVVRLKVILEALLMLSSVYIAQFGASQ